MLKVPVLLYSPLCPDSVFVLENIPRQVLDSIIVIDISIDKTSGKRPRVYYDIQDLFDNTIKFVPALISPNKSIVYGKDILSQAVHPQQAKPSPKPQPQPIAPHPQPKSTQQPQAPSTPNHLVPGTQENFTRLSDLQIDYRPVTQEERTTIMSGGTPVLEDKRIVLESYEKLLQSRENETDILIQQNEKSREMY